MEKMPAQAVPSVIAAHRFERVAVALYLVVPAIFAVLLTLQDVGTFAFRGEALQFAPLLLKWLVSMYLWPLMLYPFWLASGQARLQRRPSLSLLGHLVAGPLLAYVHLLVPYLILTTIATSGPLAMRHPRSYYFASRYFTEVILSYAFLGCLYTLRWYWQMQREQRKRLMLENDLLVAQLQMLSVQLQPHFLFNALNSVSSLMRKDVDAADDLLVELSSFLRQTLIAGKCTTITLEEELCLVKTYCQLENIRQTKRAQLSVKMSSDVLGAQVPPLILQPLVENAFVHGKRDVIRIAIFGTREQDVVRIRIENDGVPLRREMAEHCGERFGLENVRGRLKCMYGAKSGFAIDNRANSGVYVEIVIPYLEKEPAAHA